VLWAQRSDKVYLTVSLPDAKDVSVKCEPQGKFSFTARGVQGESFDFSLELYGPIAPEVRLKTNLYLKFFHHVSILPTIKFIRLIYFLIILHLTITFLLPQCVCVYECVKLMVVNYVNQFSEATQVYWSYEK
jgi:hypothetical protein